MHIPGVEGQRLDAPVALLDVVPTILEAIGATDTDAVLDGQSLLIPALTPERAPSERTVPCAVISQRARQGNFFRRAARRGDAVLIHNVLAQRYEYYDRGADPEELDDLYIERGEDAELGEMRDWLRETMTGTLPQQLLTE